MNSDVKPGSQKPIRFILRIRVLYHHKGQQRRGRETTKAQIRPGNTYRLL
jgi:hypothetical protein